MEFGRVPEEELNLVKFSLPEDPQYTIDTLSAVANKGETAVHAGCAKWGRKEWVGKIYPAKTKDANFLDEYVKHFNCIELNATFYQTYGPETIAKWKQKADPNPE